MNRPFLFLLLIPFFILSPSDHSTAEERQEETYSISLVQSAEADKEVKEVDGRKVLTETHEVKGGDYIWKILREKGLLEGQSLGDVLHLLKILNPSLANLDLLHPGETIVIPLVMSPPGIGKKPRPKAHPPVPLQSLKDEDLDLYTIQPGDSVIKVVKSRYDISDRQIHDKYLDMLRKMNPSIENIHLVFPGQKIRLPIYSPQVVRMPAPPPPPPEIKTETPGEAFSELMSQVAGVFKAMGVDWVGAGQHFIPLKTGGQINLNADSFPILNLTNGRRVIVDFQGDLPEKMAALITSSWDHYRVIRLKSSDTLKEAMERILSACSFPKVYRANEALEVQGAISLRVKADWIIRTGEDPSKTAHYTAVNLLEPGAARISARVRSAIEHMGVKVVEYPPAGEALEPPSPGVETLKAGRSTAEMVETVLRLAGVSFSRDAEIPVYQSMKSQFHLLLKADFLLSMEGKERIIDVTGLGPEIVSLLKEHQIPILKIEEKSDPSAAISSVLDFAGVPFDSKPKSFLVSENGESRSISISVTGISFAARDGARMLVLPYPMPEPLKGFLSAKGYKLMECDP